MCSPGGSTITRIIKARLFPYGLALLAMALASPALRGGWLMDDYVHRAVFVDFPELPPIDRSLWSLFAFVGERWSDDWIVLPWWTPDDLLLAFFRPLSAATHALDFALWPERPALMHLHSLLWLGATVILAALFYRRILATAPGGATVAGLAALAFAVDDAHAMPAMWIANRNSLVATSLGLLALLAYDRWRRQGWRGGAIAAPVLFLLALLAGETAVACGAYLLAYALFLDRGSWRRRLLALAPAALVGVLWWLLYKALGFGAAGSGVYIDPGTQPVRFVAAMLERAPILLWGQWAFPPADFYNLMSIPAGRVAWWIALAALLLLAGLVAPLLRRDARARFCALGMLLSLVPSCATFPSDRLLLFPGLGAMGLLALWVADAWSGPLDLRRRTSRLVSIPLLVLHLALAPFSLWGTTERLNGLDRYIGNAAASLPDHHDVRRQQAIVVRTPSAFVTVMGLFVQAQNGRPIPRELYTLAASLDEVEIERPGARTLVLRPEGGFLLPRGSVPPGREQPALSDRYVSPLLDSIYRDPELTMAVGDRFELNRLRAEVTAVTADGRPAEMTFRFATDLDDGSRVFLHWENGGYVAWSPPAVGGRARLPSLR